MNPTTQIASTQVYGAHADYKAPPSEAQADAGVVPLDTLPAAWWNQLWYDITSRNNNMVETVSNIRDEILSVLADANIPPSALQTNQLLQAIETIRKRFPSFDAISHDPIPGAVISSSARNSVSVDPTTGQMTPNALSDWTSNNSVKAAIGEVDQKVDDASSTLSGAITDEANARAAKDVASVANDTTSNTLTTTITSSDGTTHQSTGQAIVRSVGVDASTTPNTLAVSVNGVEDSDTVVKTVSANRSGDTVTISVNGVEDTFSVASAAQDYKETEQNTGKKWVNGDKVYSKTVIGRNKQITYDFATSYLPSASSARQTFSTDKARRIERLGAHLYTLSNDPPDVHEVCLLYSSDDGDTWTQISVAVDIGEHIQALRVYNIVAFNGALYVAVMNIWNNYCWLVRSSDPLTTTFTKVNNARIPWMTSAWDCFYVFDNCLFIGCGNGTSSSDESIVCLDTNDTFSTFNYYSLGFYVNTYVCCFAHVGTRLFALMSAATSAGVALYHDAGEAGNVWHAVDNAFSYKLTEDITYSRGQFASFKGTLYAQCHYVSGSGVLAVISTDNGLSWTSSYLNISPSAFNERVYYLLYATENALYLARINCLQDHNSYFDLWCTKDNVNWTPLLQTTQWAICLGFMKLDAKFYMFKAEVKHANNLYYYDSVDVYEIDEATDSVTLYDTITLPTYQTAVNYPNSSLVEVESFPASAYAEQLTEDRVFMLSQMQFPYYTTFNPQENHEIRQPVFRLRKHTPNNHINTIPDFKHLVKCDRVVDDKPSEIDVTIDPTTGNVDVGSPVRDYEHLNGVQLLLEYTKNEV